MPALLFALDFGETVPMNHTFDPTPDFVFFNKKERLVHHNAHFHPYSQLLLPQAEGTHIVLGQQRHRLDTDCVLFLSPFVLYQLLHTETSRIDALSIHLNRLGAEFTGTPYFWRINRLMEKGSSGLLFYGEAAAYLRQVWPDLQNVFRMRHMLAVLDILDTLSRSSEFDILAAGQPVPTRSREIEFCLLMDEFIGQHLNDTVPIAEVAALTHLSVSNFNQKFKHFFGKPFHSYILSKKIEATCYLLKTTDLSLQDIAERLNFNSASHLLTTFKRIKKNTPGEYRLSHSKA